MSIKDLVYPRIDIALFACAAILLGCAAAPEPYALPRTPAVAWAPAPSIALEREVRHYVDEQGQTWDDRGRRVGHVPEPATRVRP